MGNINNISEVLRLIVTSAKLKLQDIPSEKAAVKPAPDKWSKKEILGHLIDSASNNHQRFVRAAQNAAMDFPPYNQDRWVEVQHYNEMDWRELIELFSRLNLHICRVINFLPDDVLTNLVNIGKDSPVTLEFIITDYLRHLKHHVEQLYG